MGRVEVWAGVGRVEVLAMDGAGEVDLVMMYGVCGLCGAARMPVEADGVAQLFCSSDSGHANTPG